MHNSSQPLHTMLCSPNIFQLSYHHHTLPSSHWPALHLYMHSQSWKRFMSKNKITYRSIDDSTLDFYYWLTDLGFSFFSKPVTRSSPVLHSAVVKTVWMWSPSVKLVWLICATLQTTLTLSSAKPSQSSPESVYMQVASPNNGGVQISAVRVPPIPKYD